MTARFGYTSAHQVWRCAGALTILFSASVWAAPRRPAGPVETPPAIISVAVSNILPHSATVCGYVNSDIPTDVNLYWGTADGEQMPSNWQHVCHFGLLAAGPFSTNLVGLFAEQTYFYRHSAGESWAASSEGFSTPQAWIQAVAHRGYSQIAPENTLPAFAAAAGTADRIEFDVQETLDGRLVVIHDSTVDRTTDGTGVVARMTLAQLQMLDAGVKFGAKFAGTRIPTLEEVLKSAAPSMNMMVEFKAGTPSRYVETISSLGFRDRVILTSFDWNVLYAVHALAPDIRLGAIGSAASPEAFLQTLATNGISCVIWSGLSSNSVRTIRAAGFNSYVWTVNDAHSVSNYVAWGVDGIISDDAGLVSRAVQADSDGLGVAAGWKARFFDSTYNVTALSDADEDGFRDVDEYEAGTDPLDCSSLLAIQEMSRTGDLSLLSWSSRPGRFYIVESAASCRGAWSAVSPRVPPTPPANRYTLSSSGGAEFFRLRVAH